jgi:hypothetical protein
LAWLEPQLGQVSESLALPAIRGKSWLLALGDFPGGLPRTLVVRLMK